MKTLSAIVFSVSLFPAAAAVHLYRIKAPPALVWAFGYSASIGLIVAISSLRRFSHRTTSLLGKTTDGKLLLWSWLIFGPYHLGLRIKLVVGSMISSEPLYHRIAPGWFLGGWPFRKELLPSGRLSVVDLTCELPRTHGHKYALFPVWDTAAPTIQQLDQAVEFSLNESAEGKPVYIHCAHGHGRSAVVMIACLIEKGLAKGVDHGVSLLKGIRPKVNLSPVQRQALEQWVEKRSTKSESTAQPCAS